ncbi:Probable glycolate oxidase iron-sulfur subunit [Geodia barretti]|uniref:Probable glycolate oxidase iron-sulfur subunit n=1 Tax=Geodia barretti TaxID=519541 RepID=A0AA35X7U6_GEOBA|nr:Probable glycolate oxidase iron-sulfur subunit [Geodia barretti]
MMVAVADGVLEPEDILEPLDLCLGCRACETACPAGVEFGRLLEAGRAAAGVGQPASRLGGWLRRLFMEHILPSPHRLHRLSNLLRVYQISGVQALVRLSGLLPRLAPRLAVMEALLPAVPPAKARQSLPVETPAHGEERGGVLLLTGCVTPQVLPQVNRATVRVLARNGYRVLANPAQPCCGALQAHANHLGSARRLARLHIAAFEASGADWLVVNAAGCGALMKDYGHLLADDPEFAARAEIFDARVRDISEILAADPLRGPLQPVPLRVAYDDPCHLSHGQKIRQQPRDLLRQVPGLELLEVPESDWCCGSAGTFNLFHPETAEALLDRKMAHLASVRPDVVVSGNPGCLLQLRQGAARHGLTAEILHPIEMLDRAYRT